MDVFFGMLFAIMIITLIVGIIFYVFAAVGLSTMAKRRGIENSWLAFIPIAQFFILGSIVDSINAYRHKPSKYAVILVVSSIVISCLSGTSAVDMLSAFMALILSLATIGFRIYSLIAIFKIYKDYAPNSWILFGILSAIFYIEFIFFFALRKKVPVSLCFSKQDEWQFEANRPKLQMLWEQYHAYTPNPKSWAEFLMVNFVPNQYANAGAGAGAGFNPNPGFNPYAGANPGPNPYAGYDPNVGANPNPDANPYAGYDSNVGANPNPGANPYAGYDSNVGANPNPGQNPYQGYDNWQQPPQDSNSNSNSNSNSDSDSNDTSSNDDNNNNQQ